MDTTELLRRQIEEIQVPPLPTAEEQAQIMKGRKGQADIDAGRKAIADRVQANREAIEQRSRLTTQLSDLETTGRKQAKEDYQASPEAQRNKALMTLGPSALGWGAGLGGGLLEKGAQGRAEKGRNVERQAIADSGGPRATRMEAAERSGLIPYASKTARGLGRFAPFGAGAAFFGADAGIAHALQQNADTQGEKDIYGVARNLFGGMAAGSAHAGVSSVFNPKVSPDGDALARILAPDPAPTPAAGPVAPPAAPASTFRSGVEARAYAKTKGVALPSKLTAAEAIARADQLKAAAETAQVGARGTGKAIGKAGKVGIPLAAGALAYDAASGDAEAAGASPGEARTQGAVAGTATGGATAAATYGLTKLLQKYPSLSKAVGAFGSASMPMMGAEAYDPSQEELNQDRNVAARNMPSWMRAGGIEDAYQMAQVPERNMGKTPELPQAPMGAGLPSASALQIPEGIPLPNPEGMSPYPELRTAMAAGRRPQLPYAPMGFGGRF